MKYNVKFIFLLCVMVISLTFMPSLIHAQPGPSVDCPDLPDPDVPCPIDGGLIALLAIGLFYGVKKNIPKRLTDLIKMDTN